MEPSAVAGSRIEAVAHDVATVGWSVHPDFLPAEEAAALLAESQELWESGAFRRAGVGIGAELRIRDEVRNDYVMWLEEGSVTPHQQRYLERIEELRRAINQTLFLGLWSFEAHLTVYPPGAFYRRHLDQHQKTRHRLVSVILYLDAGWREEDGGQLRLYLEPRRSDDGGPGEGGPREAGPFRDVLPAAGTLVAFLSADFYHEVLPARRERRSITGWLRTRG